MRTAGTHGLLLGALALSLGLTACSRVTEDAASPDGTEATADTTGTEVATTELVDADPKSVEELTAALSPVEEAGYTCASLGASPSGAARAHCTDGSEIDIEAYAWVDAERRTTAYASDVRCREDSPLSQLTSVQGDTWVLALMPGEGATVDSQGAIDVLSVALQEATGSPVAIQPCVAPEPPPTADTEAPADTAEPASTDTPAVTDASAALSAPVAQP